MKLSTLFQITADEYLWDGVAQPPEPQNPDQKVQCCLAVRLAAAKQATGQWIALGDQAEAFMYEAGMKDITPFSEIASGIERQGARYAWLMLCSQVAEEEGL